MNKRELMLSLIAGDNDLPHTPAGFFLHFPEPFRRGEAAIAKHIEFFRSTGMDFVKIQYEQPFPRLDSIRRPEDWARMPQYGLDFFADQIAVVEGLVKALKPEALVVVTLYSTFMEARHTTDDATITAHLEQDPEHVQRGFEIISESILLFARACIQRGVDGFYHSTQGGEAGRFRDRELFERCIKPFDLRVMREVNALCQCNILHICDYLRDYDDFTPFLDYPGQIVNSPLRVGERTLTPSEAAELFQRPYMGGMERKGVIASGTSQEIEAAAREILVQAPRRFILAADCTVPNETPWENLKAAIDTAHSMQR